MGELQVVKKELDIQSLQEYAKVVRMNWKDYADNASEISNCSFNLQSNLHIKPNLISTLIYQPSTELRIFCFVFFSLHKQELRS